MRVCHVSPHLPPDQAANALLPAQLGQWSAAAGRQVVFVAHAPAQGAASPPMALTSSFGPSKLPIRWIPRRSDTGIARLLRIGAWRLFREVQAALNDIAKDADLLHLHSNGLIVEAAAEWASRRHIPFVLTLYGTEIWHYEVKWPVDLFTRAYQHAAQVTFYSQRLLEHARLKGLDRQGLSVIYPAVAETFAARNAETRAACRDALGIREPLVILNVKRLHPLAGQTFLLEAFAKLRQTRKNVRLVICGGGPLHADLGAQAAALGIADQVTFTGLVPNDMIARYMTAADVFALPSLLEALPTVAIEALASGTPVISTDNPGGLELQGLFGNDVMIVPRKTSEPLARALDEFLDAPRRTRPETVGRLNHLFRPPAILSAFDAIYEKALRRSA